MEQFLQQLLNGIAWGSIYALIALGYTMVYGVLKLINFAHGEVYMVGAMTGYYTELGLIAKQARELGIDVPLLGGDGWDSEKTLEIGGKAVEGYFFSTHYAADSDSPKVQEFVTAYKAKYNETPDAMAALGYDTAGILADALTRAGDTEGAKLRDAIASTKDYDGVTGKISIDPARNARKDAVVLKIEGGTFKFYRSVPAS